MDQVINPKITVLMPVYNGERYLEDAIRSILNQTYADFELLIINDGSTDKSEAVIKRFNDTRIRLVNNPKNIGIVDTLNKGISIAKGEYIARMDCDDISLVDRFREQLEVLETNKNVAAVATHIVLINEQNEDIGYWPEEIQVRTKDQIRQTILNDNCIAHPSTMIRTMSLKKYKYKKNQKGSEDWDLWMRMISNKEEIVKINKVLLKYRVHSASITGSKGQKSVYTVKVFVQLRYLLNNFKRFHFNQSDLKVLRYLIGNIIKYILTSIYPASLNIIAQLSTINIFKAYNQYLRLKNYCRSKETQDTHLFFFFPFYHTGGAEKVHASILEAVSDKKPVVFITNISVGDGMREQFEKNATVIDIGLISYYPFINKRVKSLISTFITKTKNPVVFGCNSQLFYYLIPFLPHNVKCIDLIHAFVHLGEQGPEKWSLPVVERLSSRIVVARRTIEDFKKLYENEKKSRELINRIVYISNYTDIPDLIQKRQHDKLMVMYAGRNSPEKRIYLVGKIASKVKKKVEAEFIIVGGLEDGIDLEDKKYCNFLGEIKNAADMKKIYEQADILLLTSSREGFPMVIMEAMANGVLVITTAVGGIKEHVSNGITGMVVDTNSDEDIINKMTDILISLSADKEKIENITRQAYFYAKNNFDKQKFVNAYRNILINN